ncbi:hypothetical protein HKX48_006220 [Thoreauomyces humboldtii]|nr:hypothetical protein HKX48_006220 [Thoreauomyces humboldtii]
MDSKASVQPAQMDRRPDLFKSLRKSVSSFFIRNNGKSGVQQKTVPGLLRRRPHLAPDLVGVGIPNRVASQRVVGTRTSHLSPSSSSPNLAGSNPLPNDPQQFTPHELAVGRASGSMRSSPRTSGSASNVEGVPMSQMKRMQERVLCYQDPVTGIWGNAQPSSSRSSQSGPSDGSAQGEDPSGEDRHETSSAGGDITESELTGSGIVALPVPAEAPRAPPSTYSKSPRTSLYLARNRSLSRRPSQRTAITFHSSRRSATSSDGVTTLASRRSTRRKGSTRRGRQRAPSSTQRNGSRHRRDAQRVRRALQQISVVTKQLVARNYFVDPEDLKAVMDHLGEITSAAQGLPDDGDADWEDVPGAIDDEDLVPDAPTEVVVVPGLLPLPTQTARASPIATASPSPADQPLATEAEGGTTEASTSSYREVVLPNGMVIQNQGATVETLSVPAPRDHVEHIRPLSPRILRNHRSAKRTSTAPLGSTLSRLEHTLSGIHSHLRRESAVALSASNGRPPLYKLSNNASTVSLGLTGQSSRRMEGDENNRKLMQRASATVRGG